MKHFFLIFILIFSIAISHSQTTASGYYITQENDTVSTQIKIRKGVFGQTINDYIKEVEVVDSINGIKKFVPGDIKGYGFLYDGYRYIFVSKPIKDGSYKFLVPVFMGPKASLYQYGIRTSGGGYSFPSQQVFYTFEKPGSEYLFLRNILNKKFKSQVKDFFKDNQQVQDLIDTKLQYWLDLGKDLKEILQAANKE
jgi:hypothetical protein